MIENDKHHEVEDFKKTIAFESDQFAIVDADIIRSLKDKIPLEGKVIYVPTKQSKDVKTAFQVMAEYDDASLRRLVIEPGTSSSQVDESLQIRGHDGDPVEKTISRIDRIGGKSRPKSANRSERNKRYSAKGDPKIKLTKGPSSVEARIKQAVSIDGARRDNYGQPRSKIETECVELLTNVKNKTITEEFLEGLQYRDQLRTSLAHIRDNGKVSSQFDIVYESIEILDKYRSKSMIKWIKELDEDLNG